uniref:Uncharacterized protein n=1 Tax=Meloidogyne enterolobii TaxID=390850 RepID=A0A6V7WJ25_MELEN|nr:unnamed protein product [Meloidogyne enterolobii]
MATSAQRREQLEYHLKSFREIADQRVNEKIIQWSYHLPALVSSAIFICQIANTIIFATFAYNFGQLNNLLYEYMLETDAMNITLPNSTSKFRLDGVNAERLNQIDNYHDQLWNLFIAEVIELIFPAINLCMFAWIIKDKNRRFPTRIQYIYLLCPALALILSITQALTIHTSITESIYTIRFLLAKLLNQLLELNRNGRLPIEDYFECEFFNDDDIVKPPCSGQIHDTVLSKSSLTVVITIHIIPIIIAVYLLIKNLKSNKLEHLFLYIESVPPQNASKYEKKNIFGSNDKIFQNEQKNVSGGNTNNTSLKETINGLLAGFNVKFITKKIFCEHMPKSNSNHPGRQNAHSISVQKPRQMQANEKQKDETCF